MRQLSWMLFTLSASPVSAKAWPTSRYSSSPETTGEDSSSALAADDAVDADADITLTFASHTVGGKHRPASAQPCHLILIARVSPARAPVSGAVTLKSWRKTSCSPKNSS